jgi:hypothetical protein
MALRLKANIASFKKQIKNQCRVALIELLALSGIAVGNVGVAGWGVVGRVCVCVVCVGGRGWGVLGGVLGGGGGVWAGWWWCVEGVAACGGGGGVWGRGRREGRGWRVWEGALWAEGGVCVGGRGGGVIAQSIEQRTRSNLESRLTRNFFFIKILIISFISDF